MNVTDSDNDMGNFEEGNRDKIRLRIIFMCFAIGVGVGVMACVHVGRKVSYFKYIFKSLKYYITLLRGHSESSDQCQL